MIPGRKPELAIANAQSENSTAVNTGESLVQVGGLSGLVDIRVVAEIQLVATAVEIVEVRTQKAAGL